MYPRHVVVAHKVGHMASRHIHEYGIAMIPLLESPHLFFMAGCGFFIFIGFMGWLVFVEETAGPLTA